MRECSGGLLRAVYGGMALQGRGVVSSQSRSQGVEILGSGESAVALAIDADEFAVTVSSGVVVE